MWPRHGFVIRCTNTGVLVIVNFGGGSWSDMLSSSCIWAACRTNVGADRFMTSSTGRRHLLIAKWIRSSDCDMILTVQRWDSRRRGVRKADFVVSAAKPLRRVVSSLIWFHYYFLDPKRPVLNSSTSLHYASLRHISIMWDAKSCRMNVVRSEMKAG